MVVVLLFAYAPALVENRMNTNTSQHRRRRRPVDISDRQVVYLVTRVLVCSCRLADGCDGSKSWSIVSTTRTTIDRRQNGIRLAAVWML